MSRLRDDRGFTMVEVLMAGVLGVVILFAAGLLMDTAGKSQKRTTDRMEAVQRGRLAMELMTRQLRSQICLGQGRPSLQKAESDEVVFYGSLAPAPTTSGVLQIDERTLRFVPDAGTPDKGDIVETVRQGTGTPPSVTFGGVPPVTRTLVEDVSRSSPGAPIFRFHKYDPTLSPQMVELPRPVPAADRELTVRIDVAFDSYPQGGEAGLRTVYADQAFVRTADPTDPEHSPKCI